jgi:CheY-like chemotaxis protein
MLDILLIEDREDDQILFRRAAQSCGLGLRVVGLRSCREAIDYLEARGECWDRAAHPIPDLIMLDIGMPGMDGLAFLGWRQRSVLAAAVPTVVFSGLADPGLEIRALAAGAAGFVVKPQDVSEWPAAIAEACALGGLVRDERKLA